MQNERIDEWARHYDNLFWTVTTFLLTANGALFVHCSDSHNFSMLLAVGGILLTLVTVYFGASFRELRHRVGDHIDQDMFAIISTARKLYQWWAFIAFSGAFVLGWTVLLWQFDSRRRWWWLAVGAISLVVAIVAGRRFRGSRTVGVVSKSSTKPDPECEAQNPTT